MLFWYLGLSTKMTPLFFSLVFFLSHPMNFFQTSDQESCEVEEIEEDEEEDICYIPQYHESGDDLPD